MAARLLGGSSAFLESSMREAWVLSIVNAAPLPVAARALELVCLEGERGDASARELLVSLVGALLAEPTGLAARLRAEADRASRLALGRLLRRARDTSESQGDRADRIARGDGLEGEEEDEARVPDYGRGRPLTLGERRALARRPDRKEFDKLLRDPHPMVMTNLLGNPRLTAEDLVRVCARRSTPREILSAIARHPRWSRERRVRLALILNPRTPEEIAVPFVSLLTRSELRIVTEVTTTPDVVRVAAKELAVRRPPTSPNDPSGRA